MKFPNNMEERLYIAMRVSDYNTTGKQTCDGYRTGHINCGTKNDKTRCFYRKRTNDESANVPADLGWKNAETGHPETETAMDRETDLFVNHSRKRQHDSNPFHSSR